MVSLVFQPRQLPGSMLIYQRLLSKYGDISRYKQITKRWMMVGWWWVRGLTSMDSRLRTPAGFQWIRDFTIWAAVCFAIDQWGWNGWNDLVNIVILAWIQWGQYVFFGVCLKTGWIPRIYGNLLMVFCFFLQLGVLGLATFHTSHMIWAAKIRIYPDGSKWWASQKWMALRSTSFSAALLVAHVEPWRKKQLVKAGGESLRIEVSRQGDRHQKCKNGWFKICLHP